VIANETPLPEEPEANATQNGSNATGGEEEAPGVPRNISDRIGDGVFPIKKTPFEPLYIYVINDSHADAILVRKGTFTMLIDAGNFLPVRALLDELYIARINVLVATHDSPGAIGGMEDMVYGYAVDELWDNNVAPSSDAYKAALAAAAEKGITVKHPQEGDNLTVNGLDIRILNPQKQRMKGSPESDAIVMRLGSGKFCAMLLNPTVQEMETALIGRGVMTSCPVATFFNHGEGRPVSSLLIEGNAALEDVIISVGSNNDGLPSSTTLARLGLKGYNVWRTDRNGTAEIYADWVGNYQISEYVP
jgi:beta-lactamase superfamily II metal-dependent hydrolase